MRGSLLGRLLWRLSLVSAVLTVIVTVIVVVEFQSTADTLRDRNLSGQVSDVARHLRIGDGGRPRLDLPLELRDEYAQSGGMFVYQVLNQAGNVVLSSTGRATPLYRHEDSRPGKVEFFRLDQPAEGVVQTYFGASLSIRRGPRLFYVQVAQGPTHSDVLADEFLEQLWEHAGWVVAVVFLVIVGIIYITVRASLAPIEAAARDAAAIGPQAIDRRIAVNGVPSEVRPLVESFNKALDRIGESYRMQREFTANAAHELRTPIAILRAHVDSLEDRSVARDLGADIGLLDRMVGQLLRLARADDLRIPAGSTAELNAVAVDVAALMGPTAIGAGKSIAVNKAPQPVTVRGDAGQIAIALRNLIENGLRASPTGSTVEVSVAAGGALAVTDQGSGVSDDIRDRIFERFWRDDQSGEGAGLGLSIVRRIAEAHGGTADLSNAPAGGARFTLRFQRLSDC